MSDEQVQVAPRRTLSPEHKAKMAAGRQKHMAERSRGRPAFRAEPAPLPRERPQGYDGSADLEAFIDSLGSGEHLTRETSNSAHDFDVPLQGRRPGWDYQWFATHIMGQEVDSSYEVNVQRGSWFPVPASHFPQLCPAGWSRSTIDRLGMRLYMRPMRLTEEARAENERFARDQKMAKLMQAQTGDTGREFAQRVQLEGIKTEIKPLL